MILLGGERAVWAAVYAAHWVADLERRRQHHDGLTGADLRRVADGAIWAAQTAVRTMREAAADSESDLEEDEVAMLRAMLGEE
jgi:trimethylamine:corrinoid methyltransferase-like protein